MLTDPILRTWIQRSNQLQLGLPHYIRSLANVLDERSRAPDSLNLVNLDNLKTEIVKRAKESVQHLTARHDMSMALLGYFLEDIEAGREAGTITEYCHRYDPERFSADGYAVDAQLVPTEGDPLGRRDEFHQQAW